ncbi:MAG: hypothetical protein J2P51_16675, partial [Hyphomicrobiaceae bacterium]|nr:hypothetical protein [Hyphomicrobiaceae bacterium]
MLLANLRRPLALMRREANRKRTKEPSESSASSGTLKSIRERALDHGGVREVPGGGAAIVALTPVRCDRVDVCKAGTSLSRRASTSPTSGKPGP